jgi:hypothetical protein
MSNTNIVMVLDASGSMENIRDDIIGSVNAFVAGEQAEQSQSLFTLVTFSNDVETKILKKSISSIQPLSRNSYVTTGSTALYKAIVDTITKFENESDVVMCIVTDGEENHSPKEYTRQRVFDLVTKCQKDKGWTFNYLSADIDTFNQGVNLGFGNVHCDNINIGDAKSIPTSCNTTLGYGDLGKKLQSTCKKTLDMNSQRRDQSAPQRIPTSAPQKTLPTAPQSSPVMSDDTNPFSSMSNLLDSMSNFIFGPSNNN